MKAANQPRLIQTTPMVSDSNMQARDEARRSMLGKHTVSASELRRQEKLESFQRSGLVAMQDHEMASRGKLALTGSAAKGFAKLLLSFKIFQVVADGALFVHGRLTKEPFHAKMDEKLEAVMHALSKGYTTDISKFDPESYIACMDNFVLGENTVLPETPLADLNKLLVDMLVDSDRKYAGIENKVKTFLVDHQIELNGARLSREVVPELEKGNGMMTPKILLAKLIHEMKVSGGDVDNAMVRHFTADCKKIVDFYDLTTAMSLYSKSIDNMRILEAAAKKELSKLEKCREALDVTTDFLMRFVPFIYMFVVANLIIDRNISGETKTTNFNEYMDDNFSHFNQTMLDSIKDFAGNYFKTNKVEEFGLKWGNLMPTSMAVSLYFLSTFRLGITVVSPKNEATYVNHAIEQLTQTYKAIISSSGQERPAEPPDGAGRMRMEPSAAYQHMSLPSSGSPSVAGPAPQASVAPGVNVEEQTNTQAAANVAIQSDGSGGQPPAALQEPAMQDATAAQATEQEPGAQAAVQEPAAQAVPQEPVPQEAPAAQPTRGAAAVEEPGQFKMTIEGGETVSMAELVRDPDKYDLKCSDVMRAYFNALEGAKEKRLEKIYRTFSGGLIGVRALNNVAFEGKDATPDVPARDWIYDNICARIIIPLSAIENRGVIDNMMNEQEKARVMEIFGKIFNNQALTKEDEDLMQGVINSVLGKKVASSSYGTKKSFNLILTWVFMGLHMGILFADFATAVSSPDGKSALDPLFQKSMGLLTVGVAYKLFYRPILEAINVGTFALQHGWKNISRFFILAAWNVIGRSVTSAPALVLWGKNTTNFDTLATLVDSAGTTGHDQSTHTNLRKATLESNIDQARALLHTFISSPQLWGRAFDQSSSAESLPMNDFAGVLSQRLDLVAKDLELFSQSLQIEEPVPVPAGARHEMKTYV